MRVALIFFCPEKDRKTMMILKNLETSSTSCGNQVEIYNGYEDMTNTRLTIFDYIAVLVQPQGFIGGKIAPRVSEFLVTSGIVNGKKGCALVLKSGLSSEKTCRNLMKVMEAEGICLDYSAVIRDEEHALYVGKKVG